MAVYKEEKTNNWRAAVSYTYLDVYKRQSQLSYIPFYLPAYAL